MDEWATVYEDAMEDGWFLADGGDGRPRQVYGWQLGPTGDRAIKRQWQAEK